MDSHYLSKRSTSRSSPRCVCGIALVSVSQQQQHSCVYFANCQCARIAGFYAIPQAQAARVALTLLLTPGVRAVLADLLCLGPCTVAFIGKF